MSSVLKAFGAESMYPPLKKLNPDELSQSRNIVLFVIDGLGYEFFAKHSNGFLKNKLRDKITSVFPSTTATGITTFLTGLAPQQHAITGWFMWLKELGVVARILPFNPRYGGSSLSHSRIDASKILNQKSLFENINAQSHYMIPIDLYESDYTIATSRNAIRSYFSGLEDCLSKIKELIYSDANSKIIYTYWAEFDSLCHKFGTESAEVKIHFEELNKNIVSFSSSIKGTNTTMIITADHGLIDTADFDCIKLKEHAYIIDTLTMPLCGEPRVAYCYVHPSKTKKFEEYVENELMRFCWLRRSEQLIKDNYFGLFEPSDTLFDRIGDYVMIMKDSYIIKDYVLGEEEYFLRANHGGVSKEEMFVPLIIVKR